MPEPSAGDPTRGRRSAPPAEGMTPWLRAGLGLAAQWAAFFALLFVTRFVARGHLVPQSDQECHIGGIAVDVLAHGIRFPVMVYAPNEYDNGSFFSGLLAAGSFALFGRNLLALKLVTHAIVALGAVATLDLLRGCLAELGVISRRARWTAAIVLVAALALAPRLVTFGSTYAVGNHAEGTAIDTVLLALFARRVHADSRARTAVFWALVGFALYLNKGTALVIPVLAVAEVTLAEKSLVRLAAGAGGFVAGVVPELAVIRQRQGMGWAIMASKAGRNSQAFPSAFFDSLGALADFRTEILIPWALALGVGTALLVRVLRAGRLRSSGPDGPIAVASPTTLAVVVGVAWCYIAALAVMAQGGIDTYALYGYPPLIVLYATLLAWVCALVASRGPGAEAWCGAAAVLLTLIAYRPDAVTWSLTPVSALWRNRAGAACFWRFAEGFEREQTYGLGTPGETRERHAIERCRSFGVPAEVLDCIGGIARELNWRHGGAVEGEPPAELTADERRAYAYHWGTHRAGDARPCGEFTSTELRAECAAAVRLECLVVGGLLTRFASGRDVGRPRCSIPEPPMDGYWATARLDLLSRGDGQRPAVDQTSWQDDLAPCAPIFAECY